MGHHGVMVIAIAALIVVSEIWHIRDLDVNPKSGIVIAISLDLFVLAFLIKDVEARA